jgi:hypothetical protein
MKFAVHTKHGVNMDNQTIKNLNNVNTPDISGQRKPADMQAPA